MDLSDLGSRIDGLPRCSIGFYPTPFHALRNLSRRHGVQLFLNPVQDLRMGGRSSNSTYQYTLKSDNSADLKSWALKLADAMKTQKALTDVDSDQADNGVETFVTVMPSPPQIVQGGLG